MDLKKWGMGPKKLLEILNRGSTADAEVIRRIKAKYHTIHQQEGRITMSKEEHLVKWFEQETAIDVEADDRITQELLEKYETSVGFMLVAEQNVIAEPTTENILIYRKALASSRKAHELKMLWDNRPKAPAGIE